MQQDWGLLSPASADSVRRTRGLELGSAVRHYNEVAVPGLGGLWFGKALIWSLLGLRIARETGNAPIPVANAIEALACWQEIRHGRGSDPRIRGQQKLAALPADFATYRRASGRTFYVSQPMRQGMTQPLLALGLVESSSRRFNAFWISTAGKVLLDESLKPYRPYGTSVHALVSEWVGGGQRVHTSKLQEALSPRLPLPEFARSSLRNRLVDGTRDGSAAARRSAVMSWVKGLKAPSSDWRQRPTAITKPHWDDLHTGGLFFQTRDCALTLLDQAESVLQGVEGQRLETAVLAEALDTVPLSQLAAAFLARPEATLHPKATAFCQECVGGGAATLQSLVQRDGRGLRLADTSIAAGPAFRGQASTPGTPAAEEGGVTSPERLTLPRGISARVRNAWALHQDLEGDLDAWLAS